MSGQTYNYDELMWCGRRRNTISADGSIPFPCWLTAFPTMLLPTFYQLCLFPQTALGG